LRKIPQALFLCFLTSRSMRDARPCTMADLSHYEAAACLNALAGNKA